MRVLVVYYSWTGHTKQVAEAIAKACDADLEKIQDVKDRAGFFGYLRSAYHALTKQVDGIRAAVKDPADYDLVVLGTPVWAWNLSPPMRTYISAQSAKFGDVGFFCTEGGAGGDGVFKQMAELSGKRPVATLIVTEAELKNSDYGDELQEFAQDLARHSTDSDAGGSAQIAS